MTKLKLILMLIFGFVYYRWRPRIFDGLGYYNHFYSHARHTQIVSINYGTDPNQLS